MKGLIFLKDTNNYKPKNALLVSVSSEIKTKEELFQELKRKLLFPKYFGFNWDALLDCLKDFHWINEKLIVLIHDEISSLDEQTLRNYLEILNTAVGDWEQHKEHILEIAFSKEDEAHILSILKK